MKENRKVALTREDQQKKRYQAVSTLDLPEDTTRQVWLEDVSFPVLLAHQVFINKDGSTGEHYLVTSDLTLDWTQMTRLYQRR